VQASYGSYSRLDVQVVFARIILARTVRAAAFGALSVALALYLAQRGFSTVAIGFVLTIALLAGAASSMATDAMVRRLGRRATLEVSALAMCAAGLLLSLSSNAFVVMLAALLGTVSAGGQEVGPFGAIEQHAIAETDGSRGSAHRFALYNLAGALAMALGALIAAELSSSEVLWYYAASGIALMLVYSNLNSRVLPDSVQAPLDAHTGRRNKGNLEVLTALFGLDALAGGFVVQSFIAYWLHLRYGVDQHAIGILFFGSSILTAISMLVAAKIAQRIGLLRTMVFTHLPSNVLLCLIPLMPTYPLASAMLLARFALSQMDVPTRQALTMQVVEPAERFRAAGWTNAVRPAAAAISPVLAGLTIASAPVGLPFFIAGGLKILYDIILYAKFRGEKR